MMRLALPTLLTLLVGCLTTVDDGATDAGGASDAGLTDAGMTDAGMADAGMADAGVIDAGVTDAGVTDAGVIDAGALDGGVADAGRDAGCWGDADCPAGSRCQKSFATCGTFDYRVQQTGGRCRLEACAAPDCAGSACNSNAECNWDFACTGFGGFCREREICAIVVDCPPSCPVWLGPNDNCPLCVCERC